VAGQQGSEVGYITALKRSAELQYKYNAITIT